MDRKWNSSRRSTTREDNPNIIEERVVVKTKGEAGKQPKFYIYRC
jgi:hypothetical protein